MRCRNCDRVISLRRRLPSRSLKVQVIRTDQPESEPPETHQPVFRAYPATSNSRKRKAVRLAAAALVLLALIITGSFFGYPLLFPQRPPDGSTRETSTRPAPAPAGVERQPVVLLETDLAALRQELQSRLTFITDDPRWRFATAVLDSAGPLRAKLFLYPDPKSQMLPVLVLQGNRADDLQAAFLRGEALARILLPAEGKTYRFSPGAVQIASRSEFPAERYRVWFHPGWAVCAPQAQSPLWEDGKERWRTFPVARFSETLDRPIRLAGLTVRIPQDLPRGWTRSLIPESVRRSDPEARQTIDAAAEFLALLDRSMGEIESLSAVFQFAGDNGRSLQYAQEFRQGIDGNQVFTRLQSGNNHRDRRSITAIFGKLLHHDQLNTTVELRDHRLTVSLEWQAEDDQVLLQAVMEAVFGPDHIQRIAKP